MHLPILETKLHMPPLRRELVHRPRLMNMLNHELWRKDSFGRALTLVSAPAGFGKTTLVVEWANSLGQEGSSRMHFCWLSLYEEDNDPIRFLSYIAAAFLSCDSEIGRVAMAMLKEPKLPSVETFVASIINDALNMDVKIFLILDDFHLINSQFALEFFRFFLTHLPPQIHVVVTTRSDPPVPISKMRVLGHMLEIRQNDLRFTHHESAEFLRSMDLQQLSLEEIKILHERTEGWAVGLQLAALSIQRCDDTRRFVDSFSGVHHFVLDYLLEEVFRRQPDDVREFLLKTSILNRFCSALCDCLLENQDASEMLLVIEKANLFLVALDHSRNWYRYHSLFSDFLRERLRNQESREVVAGLHRKASCWYSGAGLVHDAVHHAREAEDWLLLKDLILKNAREMIAHGEVKTVSGWIQFMDEEMVVDTPGLCIDYAWALILTGKLDTAEKYIHLAEKSVDKTDTPGDECTVFGELLLQMGLLAHFRNEPHKAIEFSREALEHLPASDRLFRCIAGLILGLSHRAASRLQDAQNAFIIADQACMPSDGFYPRLVAISTLGEILVERGLLQQAAEKFRTAINLGQRQPSCSIAHVELAGLLYEWNELGAAEQHLRQAVELGCLTGNADIQTRVQCMLARYYTIKGRRVEALELVDKARRMIRENDVTIWRSALTYYHATRIAMAHGDLHAAEKHLKEMPRQADAALQIRLVEPLRAELLMAHGKRPEAFEMLKRIYAALEKMDLQCWMVDIRCLQALCAPSQAEAVIILTDNLLAAQAEGYMRTFLDKGTPMRTLLGLIKTPKLEPYVSELLKGFHPTDSLTDVELKTPSKIQPLLDPLSGREIEVLALVANGFSNQAIAKKLHISIGTVKTHVHSILGKLQADNRTNAVVRARKLGLIETDLSG